MKLCYCNNCGGVWEDMNPDDFAHEYPNDLPVKSLVHPNEDEFWSCPVCLTDEYLSDNIPEREIALIHEGIFWVETDPATNQYGRQLSTYTFEFKENGRRQEVVDLTRYSFLQIVDTIESYYESMAEMCNNCGKDTPWIIAECLYETGLPQGVL